MVNNLEVQREQLFTQSPGNIVSNMDGEIVMLSVENGKYYNLGELGGEIWDLLKEPISKTELVAALQAEYDVDEVQCGAEVTAFINQLLSEGLIHTVES